ILALTGIGDMERLIGRIVYGTGGGRDLAALRSAAEKLPAVRAQLSAFASGRLAELRAGLDELGDVAGQIARRIADAPPFPGRAGEGACGVGDRRREIQRGGTGFLAQIEAREKERTGIRTLKVKFNKVFGYYIEVSNSFKDQVPPDYIRKHTLVNAERYITQE